MKFAYIREANISHLRSKYFTAKLFHMAKPYFTRRRRISLKKAHIVLVDKCVLFSGGPSGTQNPQFAACSAFPKVLLGELLGEILLLQNSRGSSQFSSSKKKEAERCSASFFLVGHRGLRTRSSLLALLFPKFF